MAYDIGLLLDGLILVFLAVTIVYAAKLSLFLKNFREGREGIRNLIRDLSVTVDKAEESIHAMKENAKVTATELQEIINESKFLSDELRFMNEAGDGLASRLEKLADRNRELVDLMESSGGIGTQKIQVGLSTHEKLSEKVKLELEDSLFEIDDFNIEEDDEQDFRALGDGAYREEEIPKSKIDTGKIDTGAKSKVRSFAIFDRDYTDDVLDDVADDFSESLPPPQSQFHSRAEKDLYDALQRKKRVSELS